MLATPHRKPLYSIVLTAKFRNSPEWYGTCVVSIHIPRHASLVIGTFPWGSRAVTTFESEKRHEEDFLGYHIRERDGIYIAVPRQWAHGKGETIVSTDLVTLRDEIRRWWFQVGSN